MKRKMVREHAACISFELWYCGTQIDALIAEMKNALNELMVNIEDKKPVDLMNYMKSWETKWKGKVMEFIGLVDM